MIMQENTLMVQARGLCRTFVVKGRGAEKIVEAVRSLDLAVYAGEIFGLLGPNGAGKTTTMRMLCTLLKPTAGTITIAGYNLTNQQDQIRKHIGYVGQKGGMERRATGRTNLIFQAELYGMKNQQACERADQVIKQLHLESYADRKVETYSGGQRRIFDLAAGIIHTPKLLFLDEPSTGLDPKSRSYVWQAVQQLNQAGTTVVLTTHYLEEADALCDRVAIVDRGQLVALDTPAELKRKIAGDIITMSFNNVDHVQQAANLFKQQMFVKELQLQDVSVLLYVDNGDESLPASIALMHQHALPIKTVRLSRPTLDDVFLKLTGHSLTNTEGGLT
jgi:ABC-2 type transport system ATP-binding protein